MNIKGLDKINMPRTGDVMIYKKDTSLKACQNFNAQVQVLGVPASSSRLLPVAVRCGARVQDDELIFKVGKRPAARMESPGAQVQRGRRSRLRAPTPFSSTPLSPATVLPSASSGTTRSFGKITKVEFKADK